LAHGEIWCPIHSFDAGGNLQSDTLGNLIPKDTTTTCSDLQWGPSFFIDENQYNSFIANGIQAKKLYDTSLSQYYWIVTQMDVATYCGSKGFRSYNFDCINQVISASGAIITPATAWSKMRSYGFGETTDGASYTDAVSGEQYRRIRYVDLDVA